MARKSKANDLKAKQARQKKLLAVLGVVMVALAVIQVPKVMHHKSGNLDTLTQSVTTTPLATTPGTTLTPPTLGGGTDTTAAGAAPVTTPAVTPTTEDSGLADTSGTPVASYGQLVQFDLFASKDPFVQQVNNPADASAATSTSSAGPGGRSPTTPTTTTTTTGETTPFTPPSTTGTWTTGSEPMTAVAWIAVNGTSEPIPRAHDFPTAEPIFHLVSYTATSAKIAVVGGSYQNGAATIELVRGTTLTLQNTVSGTTYKVAFLGARKVPTSSLPTPAAQAPAATTTATTATIPTTTPTDTTATTGTTTTTG